jgi:hypothetical protein
VIVHVAARIGGPQRGPAGAHRGKERRFVVDPQKAFELAGEIGALAVLDQRRGAHRARRPALRALRPPRRQQRIEDFGRDRLLVEAEPDLDREPALVDDLGAGEAAHHVVEPERRDLRPIGVRAEAKAAGRRQAGARQRREVRGLRPDAVGIGRARGAQRDDIVGHEPCSLSCRSSWPGLSRPAHVLTWIPGSAAAAARG